MEEVLLGVPSKRLCPHGCQGGAGYLGCVLGFRQFQESFIDVFPDLIVHAITLQGVVTGFSSDSQDLDRLRHLLSIGIQISNATGHLNVVDKMPGGGGDLGSVPVEEEHVSWIFGDFHGLRVY